MYMYRVHLAMGLTGASRSEPHTIILWLRENGSLYLCMYMLHCIYVVIRHPHVRHTYAYACAMPTIIITLLSNQDVRYWSIRLHVAITLITKLHSNTMATNIQQQSRRHRLRQAAETPEERWRLDRLKRVQTAAKQTETRRSRRGSNKEHAEN